MVETTRRDAEVGVNRGGSLKPLLQGEKDTEQEGTSFGNWVIKEKRSKRGKISGPVRKKEKKKIGGHRTSPIPTPK